MTKKVLVLFGPNLNLLGQRDPDLYGSATLDDLGTALRTMAEDLGLELLIEQRNGEGELIDLIHRHATGAPDDKKASAIIINPGAYTHYSYALHDALEASYAPALELHFSNIAAREDFRRVSVTAPACSATIAGFGPQGALLALQAVANWLEDDEEDELV